MCYASYCIAVQHFGYGECANPSLIGIFFDGIHTKNLRHDACQTNVSVIRAYPLFLFLQNRDENSLTPVTSGCPAHPHFFDNVTQPRARTVKKRLTNRHKLHWLTPFYRHQEGSRNVPYWTLIHSTMVKHYRPKYHSMTGRRTYTLHCTKSSATCRLPSTVGNFLFKLNFSWFHLKK